MRKYYNYEAATRNNNTPQAIISTKPTNSSNSVNMSAEITIYFSQFTEVSPGGFL